VVSLLFDVVAEPRGVAMGKVIAPDHVHGRGMHPSQSSYLHNHPTGPGGPVDHPLPGRDATL